MIKCEGNCKECGKCMRPQSSSDEMKKPPFRMPDSFACDKGNEGLGMAIDIGTTTVAGYLVNLSDGKIEKVINKLNPQGSYGADVISRINYSIKSKENKEKLEREIHGCISDMCSDFNVRKMVLCGNTTMMHIVCSCPLDSLAVAPFKGAYRGEYDLTGQIPDLAKDIQVYAMAGIGGHVGSDITAGILSSNLEKDQGVNLLMDIGTNGEMAICKGKEKYVCSTAAGPVFEGAGLKYGMPAIKGAINRIDMNQGDLELTVVGESEPNGICGSGVIDFVAVLLREDIIDRQGKFKGEKERVFAENKVKEYRLLENSRGEKISLTQKDIRQIQTAKSAIMSGALILKEQLGTTGGKTNSAEKGNGENHFDSIKIAGALGSNIDLKNASDIGLIPRGNKLQAIGNAAGGGAVMVLLSEEAKKESEKIAREYVHIELADIAQFQKLFLENMFF